MADGNQVENAGIPAEREEAEAPLSVRDELVRAFEESAEPVESTTEKTGETKTADQGARDPTTGRFARQEKTETTAKAPEKTATGQTAVAVTAPAKADAPATGATAVEPPQHWSEADKAKFREVPETSRAWIMERHRAMEGDYTRKMQGLATFTKEYAPVEELFKPYMQELQQRGQTKAGLIQAWAAAELRLNQDPVAGVLSIARAYGLDGEKLIAAIQQNPNAGQQQQVIDPRVTQLQQRLESFEQSQQQARLSTTRQSIEQFAAATNQDGSPAHPHFDECLDNILQLAQAERSAGRQPDMQKLYDAAVWANDATRTKLLNARDDAARKASAEAAKTKSASARRAGSSVTGAPNGPGQAAKPASGNSVREAILAAHDEVVGAG